MRGQEKRGSMVHSTDERGERCTESEYREKQVVKVVGKRNNPFECGKKGWL